ncbi:MAG: acyl-CoA dehydrogenase family protein [Acetobacteraceae bacterium]
MNAGTECAAVEAARALAPALAETAAAHDREASFPFDNIERLRGAGLLGAATEQCYGGQEIGLSQALRIVEAVSRAEPSTGLIVAQQYLFHRTARMTTTWPASVRERVGVSAVADGALANSFRVEPALGTPLRGGLPETMARKVPGGWSLSGHKIYCTGAPGLTWAAIWARTDEAETRVGTFLVQMPATGLRIEKTWDHMGMRASGSDDVFLEDVFVPDEYAVDVRPPARWIDRDPAAIAWNGLTFAVIYHGVAKAARDWLIRFLQERVPSNLGAALATLPRMQEAVGEIDALLQASDALFALADRVDAGNTPAAHEIYLAKYTINVNAIAAVEKAVALIGNPALARTNPLERHLRDVLCARIHSPQADTALVGAGRVALGVAKS